MDRRTQAFKFVLHLTERNSSNISVIRRISHTNPATPRWPIPVYSCRPVTAAHRFGTLFRNAWSHPFPYGSAVGCGRGRDSSQPGGTDDGNVWDHGCGGILPRVFFATGSCGGSRMQRKRCHDRHHGRAGNVRLQGGFRVLLAGESVVLLFLKLRRAHALGTYRAVIRTLEHALYHS